MYSYQKHFDRCDLSKTQRVKWNKTRDAGSGGGGQEGQPPPLPFTRKVRGTKVPFQFKGLPRRNNDLSECAILYEFASENARNAVIELQE
jgi:hypothetical protein